MFNRSFFTRLLFNRAGSTEPTVVTWNSKVLAEGHTSVTYERRRQFNASVQAETPDYVFYLPRVEYVASAVMAESSADFWYIRERPFEGSALAESYASAPNLYGLNVDFIKLEGLTLLAGDELIIDTDNMTVTLNGVNVIQYVSDDSTFFPIHAEDEIEVNGSGQAGLVVQWKDRWY